VTKKKSSSMKQALQFRLDDTNVRFTPDGSVAVVDAIGALGDTRCPKQVWEAMKRHHPRLNTLCSEYAFAGKEVLSVADRDQWRVIQEKLLDYLPEPVSSGQGKFRPGGPQNGVLPPWSPSATMPYVYVDDSGPVRPGHPLSHGSDSRPWRLKWRPLWWQAP
jgi:hypothetical protein